jgi:hypothetical protein
VKPLRSAKFVVSSSSSCSLSSSHSSLSSDSSLLRYSGLNRKQEAKKEQQESQEEETTDVETSESSALLKDFSELKLESILKPPTKSNSFAKDYSLMSSGKNHKEAPIEGKFLNSFCSYCD